MAVPVLDICPFEADICMTRGDSKSFGLNMFEPDGVTPRVIAGFTYTLTVSAKKNPVAGDPILFSLPGAVISPQVLFSPSTSNTDLAPKKYFFDIQETNGSGELYTIVKGIFTIEQDITK